MLLKIRASMLPSANDCMKRAIGQQYRSELKNMGYILKEKNHNIGGIIGTSLHVGSQHTIIEYLKHGNYAKTSDCIEVGINKLKSESQKGIQWDNTTYNLNEAEKQLSLMVNSYCLQIAPKIKPSVIPENSLKAIISGEVEFTGTTDIETVENDIRDIKGGIIKKPFQAQQGGYSILKRMAKKENIRKLIIDYIPRVSLRKNYPGATSIEYNVDTCEAIAMSTIFMINKIMRKFMECQNPFIIPCNPMSMLCSDKYCPCLGTDFCKL